MGIQKKKWCINLRGKKVNLPRGCYPVIYANAVLKEDDIKGTLGAVIQFSSKETEEETDLPFN